MKPILNLNDVTLEVQKHGKSFEAKMGSISNQLEAKKLGYRLTVVPPCKKAWPYHSHHVNEEMFLVLEGKGILRYGGKEYPIKSGDVICAPPGDSKTAHQIINNSEKELKYLCVSTMEEPEVAEYPDSGKFGVIAGSAPGGSKEKRTLTFFGKRSSAVNYWDGED